MSPTTQLTTIFTPPASCFNTISYPYSGGGFRLGDSLDCIPPGEVANDRSWAFSPALNCPVGFVTATTTSVPVQNGGIETRAVCCPDVNSVSGLAGFSFTWNLDSTLVSYWRTLGCRLTAKRNAQITVYQGSASIVTTLQPTYGGVVAPSVQIAWQASDGLTAPLSSPTNLTGRTSPGSTAASPSSSSVASSEVSGGISNGAKIAIGVVIPVFVIAVVLGLLVFVSRRRKNQQKVRDIHQRGDRGAVSTKGAGILVEKEPGVELT